MANEIMPVKSYLVIGAESTWGTVPGSPTYIHLPVDSYGVAMQRDRRNATPFLGIRSRKHGKSFRGMPSGQLSCPFYGFEPSGSSTSLAQTLIDWALNLASPNATELPSYFAEWAEGPDVANVQHAGLRVNNLTIAGDAGSGRVMLNLDLMGKTEAALATAQTLPDDRELCVEAEFSDCTFSYGGSAISLESFQLSIANNLAPKYLNGTSPALLLASQRVITWSITPIKNSDTFAALNRAFAESESTGQIVIKGLHNGTGASGTYNQVTIAINRTSFVQADDQRGFGEVAMEPRTFDCLKPDSSSNELTLTWAQS